MTIAQVAQGKVSVASSSAPHLQHHLAGVEGHANGNGTANGNGLPTPKGTPKGTVPSIRAYAL